MSNQYIFIGLSILILSYFLFVKRRWKTVGLAFIISVFWVRFSGIYTYSDGMYMFLGVNLFTLISWTSGLTLFKELYDTKILNPIGAVLLWVTGVLFLEWLGYHIMGIQLSSNYSGVFGTDILHVPVWAHIYYLTIGPVFIVVTSKLGIK